MFELIIVFSFHGHVADYISLNMYPTVHECLVEADRMVTSGDLPPLVTKVICWPNPKRQP